MHTLSHEERLQQLDGGPPKDLDHSASLFGSGHPKIWIRFGSERLLQRGGQARAQLRCDAHDPN